MSERVALPHFAPDDQYWHSRLRNFLTSVVWTRTVTVDTTPYNIKFYYSVFLVDTSGGNITLNLPTALSFKDGMLFIKKIATANQIVIHPFSGDTIEDVAGDRFVTGGGASLALVSSGTTWWIF